MKSKSDYPATPDLVWKLLITNFFKDFLEVFKPDLLKDVIIDKTEFLEKELLSLTGKRKAGIVDVLAKVYLRNGEQKFILSHTEIQGKKEDNFAERMFAYYIRIWDKYRTPISSMALFSESDKKHKIKNKFSINCYGTNQIFKYTLIKIDNFSYNSGIKSSNPVRVAICILGKSKLPKWKKKADVVKRLVELGYDQGQINILLAFVDRLKPLNKTDYLKFREYIIKCDKGDSNMILTSWEEKALKKGREEGVQKGIKEGIQKGIQKGRQEGIIIERRRAVQEKKEIARKLIDKKMDLKTVSEITGEPIHELKKLISK